MLAGLHAGSLTQLRNAFDAGYLRGLSILGEQIADADDTAGTVMEKRISQVCRRPWDVLIGEDVPDEQRAQALLHQAELKSFFSNLRTRNAVQLNDHGSLRALLRQMMGAVFYRYAAHEIAWDFSAGTARATLWHVPLAFMEDTTGELRFAGATGTTPGLSLDSVNWLFAVHHRALIKSLSVLYLIKKLSLSDWINFCEKFGTPGLHMETTATPGSKEWNDAVTALASFARDWSVVTSQGQKIHLIQAAAGAGEGPFAPLVDLANRAMARVVLGSDLATMSRENGAGASLQGEDTDELISADCEWISEVLNEQLSRRVIAWKFGEGVEPLAFFKLSGPQRQDTEMEMKVDDHVKKHGVVLSVDDVAERYGRTHVERPAVTPSPGAANEAVSEDLRARLKAYVKAAFKSDFKPAQEALLRLEQAVSADELRAALLALDPAAVESSLIRGEALESALQSVIAAEFLAGLDLPDPGDVAADNAFNLMQPRDLMGRWTEAGGTGGARPRESSSQPRKDVFGHLPPEGGFLSPAQNEQRGKAALAWAVRNQETVRDAMFVPGLGRIEFAWGNTGKKKVVKGKSHVGGSGLSHIIDKHGAAALEAMPHCVAYGAQYPHPEGPHKRLVYDGRVLVSVSRIKERASYVITSFEVPDRPYLESQGIYED